MKENHANYDIHKRMTKSLPPFERVLHAEVTCKVVWNNNITSHAKYNITSILETKLQSPPRVFLTSLTPLLLPNDIKHDNFAVNKVQTHQTSPKPPFGQLI